MSAKFVTASNRTAANNCALSTVPVVARFVNSGTTPQSNKPANYSVNGIASKSVSIPGTREEPTILLPLMACRVFSQALLKMPYQ